MLYLWGGGTERDNVQTRGDAPCVHSRVLPWMRDRERARDAQHEDHANDRSPRDNDRDRAKYYNRDVSSLYLLISLSPPDGSRVEK